MKETVIEQQIKISKLKRQSSNCPCNLPEVATPTKTADTSKLNNPEDRNTANASVISTKTEGCSEREAEERPEGVVREEMDKVTARSVGHTIRKRIEAREREEKERIEREGHRTDTKQGPSPMEPTMPALAPGLGLEALPKATPELFGTPKEAEGESPPTPKPSPSRQPSSVPAKTEPEKPLSLWERKKRRQGDSPVIPTPSPGRQPKIPAPSPVPAKTELEKPLLLWEFKRPRLVDSPVVSTPSPWGPQPQIPAPSPVPARAELDKSHLVWD